MSRVENLEHRFVKSVPKDMEDGVLYISLEYDTMIHLCACGCRRKVVTPLSPKDWQFSYNGQAVSVHPSIGSWGLPCRSHYIIRGGRVQWAADWSEDQIQQGRQRDRLAKRPELRHGNKTALPPQPVKAPPPQTWTQRFWDWLRR